MEVRGGYRLGVVLEGETAAGNEVRYFREMLRGRRIVLTAMSGLEYSATAGLTKTNVMRG